MTTIIQSCVETQFIETTVMLKVASQKSLEFSPPSLEMKNKAKQASSASPAEFGGWSFLQALSNVSSNPREKMDKQNAYVHPLAKQYSSSRLSEKSLELCTENLGCETGSDIMDCNILPLSLSPSNSSSKMEKTSPIMQEQEQIPPPRLEYSYSDSNPNSNSYSSPKNSTTTKAINHSSRKFPPPLTTLTNGTSSLQFRPHREEGRLVITAVEAPSKHPYFKADRSHGRLRLSFMDDTNYATKFDSQVSDVIQENDLDESEDDYEENVEEDNDFSDDDEELHHHQLDDEDDDDDDPDGENGASTSDKEDMSGNIFEIEVEMGMEKFQRLINSRCNEGGHGHKGLCCNWEPLWVATS